MYVYIILLKENEKGKRSRRVLFFLDKFDWVLGFLPLFYCLIIYTW